MEFTDFGITREGNKPKKHILDAIASFPVSTDVTSIHSWFSLVQQVAFAFSRTKAMGLFRDLMKKNRKFYWDNHLRKLFMESCQVIMNAVQDNVKAFELGRSMMLIANWSKTGVGFLWSINTATMRWTRHLTVEMDTGD